MVITQLNKLYAQISSPITTAGLYFYVDYDYYTPQSTTVRRWKNKGYITTTQKTNIAQNNFYKIVVQTILIENQDSVQHTIALYLGNTILNTFTLEPGQAFTYNNGNFEYNPPVTTSGGGGNMTLYAGSESVSSGSFSFVNSNDITFGLSAGSLTASYGGTAVAPAFSAQGGSSSFATLHFVNTNGISFSNSNGSIYASSNSTHTHSQYLNTSISSNFQQTSAMSLYQLTANNSLSLDTSYTSHTHSQYQNVSAMSLYQLTADNTLSLGTDYTSHTHSQYLTTAMQSDAGSNFINTSDASLYQLTANNSLSLGTDYTSHTHSQYLTTAMQSDAGSLFINTSDSSLYQLTANNSLSLGTDYTSHTHSEYVNTSQSSLFQQSSLMSNYLDTSYTSHTHSQYLTTAMQSNAGSNFINTSDASLYQLTANNSLSLDTSYTSHTHSQYLVANVTNETLGQVIRYNGANWVNDNLPVPVGAGNGVVFFFDEDTSGIGGYESLGYYPDTSTEQDESVTVNNNTVLLHGYCTPAVLSRTLIDTGLWEFNLYGYVDDLSGSSTFVIDVYSRTSGGSETLLFSVESPTIENTSIGLIKVITTQAQFIINDTDRLVVKISGKTTALTNVNIHFIHSGTNHNSHFNTPLAPHHNDLSGLQGGVAGQYYHLNQTDYSYRNTANTSIYQLLANSSLSLGTGYTTHTHSEYLNTSVTSNFQPILYANAGFPTALTDVNISFEGTHTGGPYNVYFKYFSSVSKILGQGHIDISAGASSEHNNGLTYSNANGISFGISSGTLTASHNGLTSQSNQAWSASNGSSAFQTLQFRDGNGISVSNSLGSIVYTHDLQYSSNTSAITVSALNTSQSSLFQHTSATSAITSAALHTSSPRINLSAGTASNNLSAFVLSNSNNVSFGLNGSTITASATFAQSVDTTKAGTGFSSAGNNIGLSGTLNTNGLSLSATVAAQSVQPMYYSASGTSTSSGTIQFANSNGVSFSLSNGSLVATVKTDYQSSNANYITSQSNQAFSASGGSSAFQTLNFANSNGFTFSNSNGSVIASYTVPTQSNQTLGAYGVSNTTQSTSGTIDARSLSFHGAGIVSVGVSNGSVVISATAAGGPGGGSYNILAAGTQTANTTGTVVFSNSNNITFGMTNNSVITASFNAINLGVSNLGNTDGTTGTIEGAGGQYVLVASHGIRFTQSTNGNSATVTAGLIPSSVFMPPHAWSGMATNSSLGQNTVYFQPFDIEYPVFASRINFYVSLSGSLSNANSTGTCYAAAGYALYTKGTGTDFNSLNLLTSYSMSIVRQSMHSNTQYAATHFVGISDQSSHSTSQYAASATNASTYQATSVNGLRQVAFPAGSSVMTPGRYWLAFSVSTVTGNGMTNNMSVAVTTVGIHPEIRPWGVNSNATNVSAFRRLQGHGTLSATSAAFPSQIAFTTDSIRAAVSQTIIHFDIAGYPYQSNVF